MSFRGVEWEEVKPAGPIYQIPRKGVKTYRDPIAVTHCPADENVASLSAGGVTDGGFDGSELFHEMIPPRAFHASMSGLNEGGRLSPILRLRVLRSAFAVAVDQVKRSATRMT